MKSFITLVALATFVKCDHMLEKRNVQVFDEMYNTLIVAAKEGYAATAKAIRDSQAATLPTIMEIQRTLMNKFQYISKSLTSLYHADKELAHAIKVSEDVWPAGNYCILGNGHCPAGFCRKEGHVHGVQQLETLQDSKSVKFGDSAVSHHGTLQLANIDIVACCKGSGCDK